MVPTWLILSATAVLLGLWLALAAWVVGARLAHDRRIRLRRRDAGQLADGADPKRWSRRQRRVNLSPATGAAYDGWPTGKTTAGRMRFAS
jgi:hypothetical protein